MRVQAWLSVCSHLLAGCVLFSCSSSSSGGIPPAPAPDPGAPTANVGGIWSAQAVFTSATGTCAPLVGQAVAGLLMFTQDGTSVTVEDEEGVLGMGTVAGNTLTFSFTEAGITESWSLVVYGQNMFLAGTVTATGLGCTAVADVIGTKVGPLAVSIPPSAGEDTASGATRTMTVVQPGETVSVALPGGPVEVVAGEEPTVVVSIEPGAEADRDSLAPGAGTMGLFAAIARHHEHR